MKPLLRSPDSPTDTADKPTDDPGRRWMLALQEGDDGAFERIVLAYEPTVRQQVRRYIRDAHRVDDLTQEVFVRVWRARGRYRASAAFRSWLATIVTRLCLNEIRGARRRRRIFADAAGAYDEERPATWEVAEDRRRASPEDRAQVRELADLLDSVVAELPPNQRAALVLSRSTDLGHRDIARTLGVSPMAVKSLILRARDTLRGRLAPYFESGARPEGNGTTSSCAFATSRGCGAEG